MYICQSQSPKTISYLALSLSQSINIIIVDFPYCITHLFILLSLAVTFPSLYLSLSFAQTFGPLERMLGLTTVLVQIDSSNTSLASASISMHWCSVGLHRYRNSGLSQPPSNPAVFPASLGFTRWNDGTTHLIRPLGVLTLRFKG